MCGYLTDPECFETYVGMSETLEWEKEKTSLKFKRADAMLVCSFDLEVLCSCAVWILLSVQCYHQHH